MLLNGILRSRKRDISAQYLEFNIEVRPLNIPQIPIIVARVVTLLVAFTVHELAHAWSASRLGDDTARRMGRITLNPLAHLDPIGTLMLIVAGFGWAKPVPVNPHNLRGTPRQSMAVVALAGPVSNVLMALIAAIPFRLGLISLQFDMRPGDYLPSLGFLLFQFVFINIILALFNMIPLPPLDGSKVLVGVLPPELAYRYRAIEQYGPILLLALIFLPGILPVMPDFISWLIVGPTQNIVSLLIA
jgi:Zn-dependent protease